MTKTDQHTFHQWLVLAKLVTISRGESVMTIDHFKHSLQLEQSRQLRQNEIKAMNKVSKN